MPKQKQVTTIANVEYVSSISNIPTIQSISSMSNVASIPRVPYVSSISNFKSAPLKTFAEENPSIFIIDFSK